MIDYKSIKAESCKDAPMAGGGGGWPQMAQAGGKDPSKIEEALERPRKHYGKLSKFLLKNNIRHKIV